MNAPAIYSSKFFRYHFEPDKLGGVILRRTVQRFGFFKMEETMRRTILAAAATLAVLAAGSLVPGRAEAMALSTPAGIQAAVDGTSLAQDVAYVCRRVWRCGPYGCGWRRYCYWTGPHPYWRHRHYRRYWHYY